MASIPGLMGRLDDRIRSQLATEPGERVLIFRCPLVLADRLDRALGTRSDPVVLVTTDLDDPLPAWRRTRPAKRRLDRRVRWVPMSSVIDPAEAGALRRYLPTALALESPRLAPALGLLLRARPRLRRNRDNWTLRDSRELLATVYAFNAVTHEGLQLRLTDPGLERWPDLEPDRRSRGKYPVSWTLRPEEVPELVTVLQA